MEESSRHNVYKTLAPTSLSLSNRHGHAVLHSHMTTTDTVTLCGREQQTQCVQNTGPYFSVTVQQTRSCCATQPHDYNRHGHAVLHSHMTTTDTATLCGREQQTQCVQNTGPYFSVTVQQTRSRCATQPHDYNRHGHAVWKRTANTMCTKHWPLLLCHCPTDTVTLCYTAT